MATYTEIKDSTLQSRVRTRYASDIAALEALGFRHLAFKLETRGSFSALAYTGNLLAKKAEQLLATQ